jgi:caffeoyl-CoA O-methyltransferase
MALVDTGLDPDIARYIASFTREPLTAMRDLRHWIDANEDPIQISPEQGSFLAFLIAATGARRVLEVGTHVGYAAMWIGWALPPEGRLTTLEIEAGRVAQARAWLGEADLLDRVEVRHVDATQEVAGLPDDSQDIVFIDALKGDYNTYLPHAVRICRRGGIVVADNTLHKGRVTLVDPPKEQTRSIKTYNETVFGRLDLGSVLLPVGDGFTLSTVRK